jgi:pimeloyl-ACP methyl ester carboxylesterase
MKTIVLCYGLMIHYPVDELAKWLQARGAHVVMEQAVPGALYVGHSLGAGRCAMLAAATRGRYVSVDPVPPISGGVVVSSAAIGSDHLSVVNDPRTRAIIWRLAH